MFDDDLPTVTSSRLRYSHARPNLTLAHSWRGSNHTYIGQSRRVINPISWQFLAILNALRKLITKSILFIMTLQFCRNYAFDNFIQNNIQLSFCSINYHYISSNIILIILGFGVCLRHLYSCLSDYKKIDYSNCNSSIHV